MLITIQHLTFLQIFGGFVNNSYDIFESFKGQDNSCQEES